MKRLSILALFGALVLAADSSALPAQDSSNPPAEGFDLAGSDPQAIALADRVMEAMGGREAWDRTRYITWKFFGRRFHVWDKQTGDIRVEGSRREDDASYVVLMNLHTGKGRAWLDGEEVTEAEALAELLDLGEAAWINDSYWLVMPYKLKDTGVTLKYLGPKEMDDGRAAQVLQLTFEAVGRTPENKYLVYVAEDSGLVEQWDFFTRADDAEPRLTTPWHGWERHGEILLSADRGDNRHTDVAVLEEVPEGTFSSPEPVELP